MARKAFMMLRRNVFLYCFPILTLYRTSPIPLYIWKQLPCCPLRALILSTTKAFMFKNFGDLLLQVFSSSKSTPLQHHQKNNLSSYNGARTLSLRQIFLWLILCLAWVNVQHSQIEASIFLKVSLLVAWSSTPFSKASFHLSSPSHPHRKAVL